MSDTSDSTKGAVPPPNPVQAHLDSITNITEHSRKEIEWERKYFSLHLKCLTAIVVAGLVGFGILYWKDRSEMRAQMKLDIDDYKTQVTNRINTQLDTSNVNSLISVGINEKVGKLTDDFITQRLNNAISPKLEKITSETEFAQSLILASRYDRKAFDKLREIAFDHNDPHRLAATNVVVALLYDPAIKPVFDVEYDFSSTGINVEADSLDVIRKKFDTVQFLPNLTPSILKAIWASKRFTLHEKLDFMIWIMKNDVYIYGIAEACDLINSEAKINADFIRYHLYIDWWDKHSRDAKYQDPVTQTSAEASLPAEPKQPQ